MNRIEDPLRVEFIRSPWGCLAATVSSAGLCALEFIESAEEALHSARQRFRNDDIVVEECRLHSCLRDIISSARPGVEVDFSSIPLDFRGTDFQISVWRALLCIPYGQTVSYSELSRLIHKERAVRAVANAVGANPVSVIVPCHRVVRADGSLGGYHWGVDIKRHLLAWEKNAE